jgi:hypothetical protein
VEGQRSPPTLLHRELWPALDVSGSLGSLEDVDRPDDLLRLGG